MCILRNNSSCCAHDGEQRNARRRRLAGAGEGAGSLLPSAAGWGTRSRGGRGGRCGGGGSERGGRLRLGVPRGRGALLPHARGEPLSPQQAREGSCSPEEVFFARPSPRSLPSPGGGKGLKSPTSHGNLPVWRGAGCAAFSLLAESRGRGGF